MNGMGKVVDRVRRWTYWDQGEDAAVSPRRMRGLRVRAAGCGGRSCGLGRLVALVWVRFCRIHGLRVRAGGCGGRPCGLGRLVALVWVSPCRIHRLWVRAGGCGGRPCGLGRLVALMWVPSLDSGALYSPNCFEWSCLSWFFFVDIFVVVNRGQEQSVVNPAGSFPTVRVFQRRKVMKLGRRSEE